MQVHRGSGNVNAFAFMLANVPGWLDPGIAIAASRCGATGILNCEGAAGLAEIRSKLARVRQHARGSFGIKIEAGGPWTRELLGGLDRLNSVVLVAGDAGARQLASAIELAKACADSVLLEVTSEEQAAQLEPLAVDGLIAKGQEAGGAVGEETAFILLQRLLSRFSLPVWVHGGVGLHSAAACFVGGAAGVVLDSQLLLLSDSSLPPRARATVERSEGDETVIAGRELGYLYRGWRRQKSPTFESLQKHEKDLSAQPVAEARAAWRTALQDCLDWRNSDSFLPLGQDTAFAAPLAARFSTISALVSGLRESIAKHVAAAHKSSPLGPGSALARSHRTEFPILQGPMTRVSDTAAFAASVAEGGALPFLALALLRGPQVKELLVETQKTLGTRPWGVGILGFVPAELRNEQMEVVSEIRPPFAIIAGGRPDQAASIEKQGTVCYLHVPSPKLLEVFVRDGARRFIFEGLECGGHIGPRTSFVLWESMIDVVQRAIDGGIPAAEFHMVFAGGIHDSRSTSMVAAMTGLLAEQGVAIGVLMGTAYLFTEEAVQGAAIVETFQNEAKRCSRTVILETGPGHATRCAETPFYSTFLEAKRKLTSEKKSHDEIRNELEQLNLGRLRLASKGIVHKQDRSSAVKYKRVSAAEQLSQGMYMIGQLAALRDQVTSIRELHQEVSAGGEQWLQSAAVPVEVAASDQAPSPPCDIAIVGMSCALPKAPDVQTFWANMINKVDGISEVPSDRFNIDLYYDPDRKARDKIYSRWGGFINDVPFEPLRYGIPPTALGSIDPMQLLSLLMVDRALDDAGYRTREFPRQKTSVIFGTSGGLGDLGGHYAVRSALSEFLSDVPPGLLEQLPEWTEDSFAGLLPNVAAGRVANRFNLGGVNFTVDAACASSMAAVYIAAGELASHASDMVIVGGVDTVQSPFCFLCFSKAQALSPRGRCRPFDESADGIAISEGITVLVMKRLADAERDGDRIYAVLKGVAGSSDGRGRSMTAPRREGQKLVLQRAYRQAGFSPSTVGLMEAHGTGTVAGDTTEMGSLSEVLMEAGASEHSCAVGSAKSLVGHTKAAAGVTGLMRVALALYHKVLPPTLHVEKPNAKLREPGSPLFVLSEAKPWLPRLNEPRRAGASSFGFGGTNFHVVLEEYLGEFRSAEDRVSATWPAELLVWNAASPAALDTSLAAISAKLESGAQPELRDLAAAQCRRASSVGAGAARLAIVATSIDDLRTKIATVREALAQGGTRLDQPAVYFETGALAPQPVAFLYPGQGSQSPDMMRDLALFFPEFRVSMEAAAQIVDGRLPRPLSSYIYPPTAFTPEDKKAQMRAITDTSVAQPALGAVELALTRLLERLGIQPSMTAGHSYGEYVALCAAGVFPEDALFRLSEARGSAMKDANDAEPGSMVAAEAPASAVTAAIAGLERVTIANYNSPRQTVLAGPVELLDGAIERLKAAQISAVKLPVACAFHSPLVEGARARLAAALSRETFSTPSVPVFSNTLGDRYPAEPAEIAALLSEHVIRPVRFIDEVRAMYAQGARIFLEVGPKGVLTNLSRQILEGTDAFTVQIDASGRPGILSLLQAVAQLIARGVAVDTAELFRGRSSGSLNIEQLKPAKFEDSQWLVNGGRAYQAARPPARVQQVPVMRTVEVEKIVEVEKVVQVPVAVPAPSAGPAPTVASAAPAASVDAIMAPFQKLMGQFLETQAAIMMAYLQGGGGAAQPAASTAAATVAPSLPALKPAPIPVAIPVTPPVVAAAPQAPIVAAPAPEPVTLTAAPARDVLAEVVRIASERTGYPAEILDVNASIEADLGIDSIKRVEILSSYQQLCTADEQARLQAVMEKLIAAPSLREIANVIIAGLGVEASSVAAPAAVVTTVAAAPARDVLAEVVRIASERTGYPAEILDVNASIEADLGIDSIKRVEILSSYQQLCTADEQARLQAVMENLIAAPSLREIANVIIAASSAPAPAPLAQVLQASTPSPTPAQLRIPRFAYAIADCPRVASQKHYPGRVCLITDDETGIAGGLAEAWAAAGEQVVLVRHSLNGTLITDEVVSGDLTDSATVEELVQFVRARHGAIGALIHLLPLRIEAGDPRSTLKEWRDHLQQDIKSVYTLLRASQKDIRETGPAGGALIAVATGRAGVFGLQPEVATPPTHQGVADFAKTVALEFPEARCKIIDLDLSDPVGALKEKLLEELNSTDDTLQVGLPGDRRLTALVRSAEFNGGAPLSIDSDWVFLITGGARGITAEIARLLAERHHPTLVIVGATPLPQSGETDSTNGIADKDRLRAVLLQRLRSSGGSVRPAEVEAALQRLLKEREIRGTLDALQRAGATVEYHGVDVRDEAAFGAVIDGIYSRYGRLDVVIHGAGIIEDKLIRDKAPESFDRVIHTKADSSYILEKKLRPASLQRLLLMSSVTAAFGNRGQADYGAANGIMNGMAMRLAATWPGRVVAVNWGPWDQPNMVPEHIRKQFASLGVEIIPLREGAEAALGEIEAASAVDPVVIVGGGPWTKNALPANHTYVHAAGGLR